MSALMGVQSFKTCWIGWPGMLPNLSRFFTPVSLFLGGADQWKCTRI